MDNRAIGVYDSGFGGLSVWRELCRLLPNESIVYLGDGKNCPYGGRSREEITGFATESVERLVEEGAPSIGLLLGASSDSRLSLTSLLSC